MQGKDLFASVIPRISVSKTFSSFFNILLTSVVQDEGGELVITDRKNGNCVGKFVCQRNSKVHIASPYSECQQHQWSVYPILL